MIFLNKMSVVTANNDVAFISMQLVFIAGEEHINAQTASFSMTREGLRKLAQDLLEQVAIMEGLPVVDASLVQKEASV